MGSRINLPFWPTSLNCLSWSSDNIIAVGGGDQIGILTPRLEGPGPNGSPWNSTVFKANAFTTAEAPLLRPLTFDNFSAGEELSLRHVHALDWSPPGLGRFRHCVLAVLSTNHILSLWDCDGSADISGNWKRKVVLNHALVSYYAKIRNVHGETQQQLDERKQVAQRVRAYAWSPQVGQPNRNVQNLGSNASFGDYGCHLMAVSTEAGDILILHIRSPYNILGDSLTDWYVQVTHKFRLSDITPGLDFEDTLVENDNALPISPSIADHLAWRLWRSDGGTPADEFLAFIAEGKIFSLEIDAALDRSFQDAETGTTRHAHVRRLIPSLSNLTGPLKFVSKSSFLTAFAPDVVYCIDTSASSDHDFDVTSHHLDGRWDEVSGLAFSRVDNELHKFQITSHLSSSAAATATLAVPLTGSGTTARPAWQAALVECKDSFSNQHDLAGHVQERTWGIASSPLGDYVATAVTLHPSDSVAHTIPSDCRTVINITQEAPITDGNLRSIGSGAGNTDHIASEVILFTLQRYLQQNSAGLDFDALVQKTLPLMKGPSSQNEPYIPADSDIHRLSRYLRSQVLEQDDMALERSITLKNIALGAHLGFKRHSLRIIERLASEVVNASANLQTGGDLSNKTAQIYAILNSKLQSKDPMMEESNSIESCLICNESIPFEAIQWAACTGRNHHKFARCALTFLAIQAPGSTKRCGVCEARVLNEWKLAELQPLPKDSMFEMTDGPINNVGAQNGPSGCEPDRTENLSNGGRVRNSQTMGTLIEPASSLARLLFAAFDTCVYCGGKFIA